MPAPIQVGNPATAGTAVYYVPPEGQPPNPGAAFLANFTATRTPWTQQVFMTRLAALDPKAQYAELQNLIGQKTRLIEQQAENARALAKIQAGSQLSADDTLRAWLGYQGTVASADASRDVARTNQKTEEMKLGQVRSDEGQKALAFARSSVNAAVAAVAGGADKAQVQSQLERDLAEAKAKVPPTEQAAFGTEMSQVGIPLDDPESKTMISRAISAYASPGERIQAQQFGHRALSPAEILAGVDEIRGGLNVPGTAPAGGSSGMAAPAGGGSFSASSTRSGPAAPSGGVGGADPIQSSIDALDKLIAQHQADYENNPFGRLGGFNDRLPGLERGGRKASPKRTAADLLPPPPGASSQSTKTEAGLPPDELMRKPLAFAALDQALNSDAESEFAPTKRPASSQSSPSPKSKAAPVDPAEGLQTRSNQFAALAAMMQPKKPTTPEQPPAEQPTTPTGPPPVARPYAPRPATDFRGTPAADLRAGFDQLKARASEEVPTAPAAGNFEDLARRLLGVGNTDELTPEEIEALKAKLAAAR